MGKFPRRRKYTKTVGKLKEFVESRGDFRHTGFKKYSLYTSRAIRLRCVELQKGFTNLVCRELNRWYFDGGSRVEQRMGSFVNQIGIRSKERCKKVCLRWRSA